MYALFGETIMLLYERRDWDGGPAIRVRKLELVRMKVMAFPLSNQHALVRPFVPTMNFGVFATYEMVLLGGDLIMDAERVAVECGVAQVVV